MAITLKAGIRFTDIGHGPLVYFSTNEMEKAVFLPKKNQVRLGASTQVPAGKIQTFHDSERAALGLHLRN